MKKGITPIIATIVLLFITMGLLAMAYTFLAGFLSPRMQKSFEIPAGSSVCVGGKITAYIYNNGQGQVLNTDFEIVQIMSSTGTIYTPTTSPFTAERGQSKIIISAYDCGDVANGCPSGTYTIKLGAGANVLSAIVQCS